MVVTGSRSANSNDIFAEIRRKVESGIGVCHCERKHGIKLVAAVCKRFEMRQKFCKGAIRACDAKAYLFVFHNGLSRRFKMISFM